MKIEELEEKVKELEQTQEDLIDALKSAEVIYTQPAIFGDGLYIFPKLDVSRNIKSTTDKLNIILDHLGLEFEWVECKPHYELKKKE